MKRRKVLLVGWDAADWKVINPLMDAGKMPNVQRLVENGIWRVTFRVLPKNSQAMDLHCYLTLYGESLTETWTYLWTP